MNPEFFNLTTKIRDSYFEPEKIKHLVENRFRTIKEFFLMNSISVQICHKFTTTQKYSDNIKLLKL